MGWKKYILILLCGLLVKTAFAQQTDVRHSAPKSSERGAVRNKNLSAPATTTNQDKKPSSPHREIRTFIISQGDIKSISAQVRELLTPGVGQVNLDESSNRLSVNDIPSKLEEISRLVNKLDVKRKPVLLEAKIIQIILSDEYKTGLDWEAILSDFQSLEVSSNLGPTGPVPKEGKLSIGTLTKDDYGVLLEALDTVGTTNILSNPKVTAYNLEETKILVGSSEPVLTTTTTTPSTGPAKINQTLNLVDIGVKLLVTPEVNDDGLIMMKLKPELSAPLQNVPEAQTTAVVKSGVTIVIGGLIKDEKMETINKIPILGDIPFVGFVFRNEDQKVRKTELVIFLTPTIPPGEAAHNDLPKTENGSK